jgi:hypothetical protein
MYELVACCLRGQGLEIIGYCIFKSSLIGIEHIDPILLTNVVSCSCLCLGRRNKIHYRLLIVEIILI